ncbi:MAG: hypothetical protein KDD62_07115 [Bdellovibrionales bacterium]|nr:hypothetical protein [Bdellovibrionales bacterium]
MADRKITIYHSPDADDAFMFYGLTEGAVQVPGYEFDHELSDIESLNQRALKAELECTAVSVHAFPYLNDKYAILTCGASMGGEDYGPRIVAKSDLNLKDGTVRKIAYPGQYTSAFLALKIFLKENNIEAELVNCHFDKIQAEIEAGNVDAGVIIHEGQITHADEGFTLLVDLGKWWFDDTKLPLPLGVNIVRKDLGDEGMAAVKTALHASIEYSLQHRDKALDYALTYGRGITKEEADVFVGMYVNERTLDIGAEGIEATKLFLAKGEEYGFIPKMKSLEFV